MQTVVLPVGERTPLRPLTEDRPEGKFEVAGKTILTHSLEQLIGLDAEKLVVTVEYRIQNIISHYGFE